MSCTKPEFKGRKHLQLQKDLDNLNLAPEKVLKNVTFECHNIAEAFGAAYVVEGSALGGMVLANNIQKCGQLAGIPKQHFFNGDKGNLEDWKRFKNVISAYNFSEKEQERAVQKAKETFVFFREIFRTDYAIA